MATMSEDGPTCSDVCCSPPAYRRSDQSAHGWRRVRAGVNGRDQVAGLDPGAHKEAVARVRVGGAVVVRLAGKRVDGARCFGFGVFIPPLRPLVLPAGWRCRVSKRGGPNGSQGGVNQTVHPASAISGEAGRE